MYADLMGHWGLGKMHTLIEARLPFKWMYTENGVLIE